MVKRFEFWLYEVDGSEKDTRPCIVVSPDEMNGCLPYVVIAPVSSSGRKYPTRISCSLLGKERFILADQLHTVESENLKQKIGIAEESVQKELTAVLQEFFAP